MATLTGEKIKDTYKALIKLLDNNVVSATSQELSDGLGNEIGIHVDTGGDLRAEGNITADGLIDIREKVDVIQAGGIVNVDMSETVYNYHVEVSGAWSLTFSGLLGQEGKAGNIILINTAATTPAALPLEAKTPLGLTIDWITTAGAVSIISYYVYSSSQIFINYLGDFK